MRQRSVPTTLAWAVLACFFISACASGHKTLTEATSIESRKSAAAGDYKKALDGFKEAVKKKPRAKQLTANYMRTVEDIKRTADGARGQKDYARAAGIYRILLDRYGDFGAFATKLTFKKIHLETGLKHCRVGLADAQAQQAMKDGDMAKAVEVYQSALTDYPGDADLSAKCSAMIGDIKALADGAWREKDFARAGAINVILLKIYPSFDGLRPPVAFSGEALKKSIADCRESLTKKGLAEYRRGNLAEAIAVWEGLLAFDPDNVEIRKAVTTARTQLDAIKKKK